MDSDDDFMYDEDEPSDPEDDQDDDFDISCDVEASGAGLELKRQLTWNDDDFQYDCLTPEIIVTTMKKSIEEVNSVFEIPSATARILLTHFKWDKEKLLERYYSGDQDGLFKEAHVISPHRNQMAHSRLQSVTSSGSGHRLLQQSLDCSICFCSHPSDKLTGMECGHIFCVLCWNEYLMMKILGENNGQSIFCPATNCDILVTENFATGIIQDASLKSKYHKLIADGFVQSNRLMRWCPAPDCSNAIKASYTDAKSVRCLCGFEFCFGCGLASHLPVLCKWLKKWLKKCDDDSETSNWISANTKECPKCHVTIEKNGGCNHMVCRSTTCKADFCWVCLGPWQSHGSSWYSCNRYDEKDAQSARDAQAISRAALERYLFYCNRYMNHLQSSKFEKKLYNQVKEKMEQMQELNMSWIEVQFLKKAVDVLCMCRNTLKYTYVFAFYLKKNNHSQIFEDNQKDLEMATETLSEYLERDMNTQSSTESSGSGSSEGGQSSSTPVLSVQDMKQKVQDKYRYCEQRRNVMLDHVYEGYDKDFWEYQEIS